MAKKAQSVKYKKAPQAPRRFKSAYMFFSTEKHKEIRQELTDKNEKMPTTEVAKLVSQVWKELSPDEREEWEELARRDKARYEVEKSMYSGPWKIPAKKRSQKDPAAPKRPMSAFLSFSNSKRAVIRKQHPDVGNAQVSRILAQMWKEAPEEERKEHIDKEFQLRQGYKVAIADWKKKHTLEQDAIRQQREQIAMNHVDENKLHGIAMQSHARDVQEQTLAAAVEAAAASDAEKLELAQAYGGGADAEYLTMAPSGFMSAGASASGYSPSLAAVAFGAGGASFSQPYQYSLGAPAYAGLTSGVGPSSAYDDLAATSAYDDLAAATSAYNAAAAGLYTNVISAPSPFHTQGYGGGAASSLAAAYGGSLAEAASAYGMTPYGFYGSAIPNGYYGSLGEEPVAWGYHLAPGSSNAYGA